MKIWKCGDCWLDKVNGYDDKICGITLKDIHYDMECNVPQERIEILCRQLGVEYEKIKDSLEE